MNSAVPDDISKEDRNDNIIIRMLPYLIVICLVGGALNVIFLESEGTLGAILLGFCEAYIVGFFFLGLFAFTVKGRSVVKNKVPLIFFGIGPFAVAVIGYLLGLYIMPDIFSSSIFSDTDNVVYDILWTAVQIYAIMIVSSIVVYGVVSVVISCFRQYIAKVYRFIEKLNNDGTDTRKGKFTLKIYDIPDVIDIERVELVHVDDNDAFPMKSFTSMAVSIFILGLVICSYFFLNPLFMDEMTIYQTIMIGIMISFFIPVLVMPWYITKETETKLISQARPLPLWKGLKKRLYQSFFAFTFFLFLGLLTIYLGSDVLRITYTYIGYVAFFAFLSVIYSYIFFSRYNKALKEGIIKKFYG